MLLPIGVILMAICQLSRQDNSYGFVFGRYKKFTHLTFL